MRRPLAFCLIPLLLVMLAACGTSDESRTPAAPNDRRLAGEQCEVFDRCYSKSQMNEYFAQLVGMVKEYSDATYPGMPHPQYVFVPSGSKEVSTDCVDKDGNNSVYKDDSFHYCPGGSRTIYVGQEKLWEYYSTIGEAAPASGLAHEWGHHAQELNGSVIPTTGKQFIQFELQADCIAGSWTTSMLEAGRLQNAEVVERHVTKLYAKITNVTKIRTYDHGGQKERTGAWMTGRTKGPAACVAYYPSAKLA